MPPNITKLSRSESLEQALRRAAETWGLETFFWDIWGNRHETSLPAMTAILTSLGVPCNTAEELDTAMEERAFNQVVPVSCSDHRRH